MRLRDAARQPERTRLAWRRTILAGTVVALLAVRLAALDPTAAGRLATAAALLGWLALLWFGYRRITAMAADRPVAAGRALPLTALAVVWFGAIGMVLIATG
jgi:hypothetical protein